MPDFEMPSDLIREVKLLADLLKQNFSPAEFIPGCQVVGTADINEYATSNGWIEAVCGQHNQQRVRWKSADTVSTASYIDVIHFPDRRLFEAWGIGGAGAIAAPPQANASEGTAGIAELATQAETDAGTDDARIVTPLKLKTTPIDHLKVSKIYESDAGAAALSADATGYLSAAVQPMVLAYKSAESLNVTGDGTSYTVVFDTEVFDRNSNYNNATGIFTAPVTGKYHFDVAVLAKGIDASQDLSYVKLVTSNRIYYFHYQDAFNASYSGWLQYIGSCIADMDVSDTAEVQLYITSGAKTADVHGGAGLFTFISVYLLP